MEASEKPDVSRDLLAPLFVLSSCAALIVLPLYGLLWFYAIDNPARPNPVTDIYSFCWSVVAFVCAIYNLKSAFRVIRGRDASALKHVAAVSAVCLLSCPAWY